jgi:superfamily I DNA/RNA helicase
MAFPGTGKTTTIFLLLQELAGSKQLALSCSEVLFLSFNKQNIADLNLKIGQSAVRSHEVDQLRTRIHTFHSFAMKVTSREKVIEKDEEADMRNSILEMCEVNLKQDKDHFKYVIEELFTSGGTIDDWKVVIER